MSVHLFRLTALLYLSAHLSKHRPKQSLNLFERMTRNVGEKRLTGAVFLDVVKAFDTV
jgi:hypothetical protein